MNLSVLYRGPLSSCNYECSYCPFAKRTETRSQLQQDRDALARFTGWLQQQPQHRWRLLFTPWGEALVRAWYRQALIRLSHWEPLDSVAIQTNLSCSLEWTHDCRPERVAFWATWHPTEISRSRFVHQVLDLFERGFRISVGTVGVADHLADIAGLRADLPSDIYVWINAQHPRPRPYTPAERDQFSQIDPLFELTLHRHRSLGQACRTGETVFTVDGAGQMRRCHFVDEIIGHIGQPDWEQALQRRPCPNQFCNCYLGLAHLEPLHLDTQFGDNLLPRIPANVPERWHSWSES